VVAGTGEKVYALTPFDRDGVAAEYAVVSTAVLAPKPARLSHLEAATLPMGGLGAWQQQAPPPPSVLSSSNSSPILPTCRHEQTVAYDRP
jgi:hypothetical protein